MKNIKGRTTKNIVSLPGKSIRQWLGGPGAKAKAETPPGTPVFMGEKRTEKIRLTVMDYSETDFEERDVENADEFFPYQDRETVTWFNINGLHDVNVISQTGGKFGIHPLVQEDIVNTSQRPKLEDYDSHFYLVLRMIQPERDQDFPSGCV